GRGQESRQHGQTESPRDGPYALLIHDRQDRHAKKRVAGRTPLHPRLAGRNAKKGATDVPTNERPYSDHDKHERAESQRRGGRGVERATLQERGASLEEIE